MHLGISTSWNAFRHTDAKKMLFEIKALGFEEVEFSFNLSSSMVEEAKELVKEGQIKISSLHNFCPIPDNIARNLVLPDYYSLASLKKEERKLAVKFTNRSIDAASELGAKALVIHCGRVEIEDKTTELVALYEAGKQDSEEYRKIFNLAKTERSSRREKYFQQLLSSLDELAEYSQNKGIILGIETRYYYREIPSLEEIGLILDKFRSSNILYWHDIGHAQVMENLGFFKHKDFLDLYADSMAGVHLHDLAGCQDHKAPLKGDFDFRVIRPYLKDEVLRILEVHHPADANDIICAKRFLEETLDEHS